MYKYSKLIRKLPEMSYHYETNAPEVADVTLEMLDALEMTHYLYRGQRMKRAPKREYYLPGHENAVYKWGQQKSMYPGGENYTGEVMPEWMIRIAECIPEPVNHAIVIRYDDGKVTHAPPHQDKLDKEGRYGFWNYSFGEPRRFVITKASKGEEDDVIWAEKLAHGSRLYMSGRANAIFRHAVPKDKNHRGVRYSLIFRTIV